MQFRQETWRLADLVSMAVEGARPVITGNGNAVEFYLEPGVDDVETDRERMIQIFDAILRNAGEIAGPQAPVLSMLPDGAVFVRLYVPETAVAQIAVGTVLHIRCDGCGDGAEAVVSYVSDEPEFTPPVIYSLENRQKLVYMIEARPSGEAAVLKPGQIVDADLAETRP